MTSRNGSRKSSRSTGRTTLLLDTGPLFANLDSDDGHHAECSALLRGHAGLLLIPTLVVTEVVQLTGKHLGAKAEVQFLSDLAEDVLAVEPVHPRDWVRIAELVWRYRDLPLGAVDASVVAAAERLGIGTIATLDRRHFGVVRPRHIPAFTLVPE